MVCRRCSVLCVLLAACGGSRTKADGDPATAARIVSAIHRGTTTWDATFTYYLTPEFELWRVRKDGTGEQKIARVPNAAGSACTVVPGRTDAGMTVLPDRFWIEDDGSRACFLIQDSDDLRSSKNAAAIAVELPTGTVHSALYKGDGCTGEQDYVEAALALGCHVPPETDDDQPLDPPAVTVSTPALSSPLIVAGNTGVNELAADGTTGRKRELVVLDVVTGKERSLGRIPLDRGASCGLEADDAGGWTDPIKATIDVAANDRTACVSVRDPEGGTLSMNIDLGSSTIKPGRRSCTAACSAIGPLPPPRRPSPSGALAVTRNAITNIGTTFAAPPPGHAFALDASPSGKWTAVWIFVEQGDDAPERLVFLDRTTGKLYPIDVDDGWPRSMPPADLALLDAPNASQSLTRFSFDDGMMARWVGPNSFLIGSVLIRAGVGVVQLGGNLVE